MCYFWVYLISKNKLFSYNCFLDLDKNNFLALFNGEFAGLLILSSSKLLISFSKNWLYYLKLCFFDLYLCNLAYISMIFIFSSSNCIWDFIKIWWDSSRYSNIIFFKYKFSSTRSLCIFSKFLKFSYAYKF